MSYVKEKKKKNENNYTMISKILTKKKLNFYAIFSPVYSATFQSCDGKTLFVDINVHVFFIDFI